MLRSRPRGAPAKYIELADALLRDMVKRGLRPGDRFGTEGELVERYGVSRTTVRQALLVLERDGYVTRHRAKGTFVGDAIARESEPRAHRGTVLVVCSNELTAHLDEDIATTMILRALERTLGKEGFIVQMLGVGENAHEDIPRLQRTCNQSDLEGICAIGSCLEPYRYLLRNVPLATSCTFNPLASPWVGLNVQEVARDCVRHLIDRGHRDIAMVCSAELNPKEFGLFVAGYREACESAGLPVQRHTLYQAHQGEALPDLLRDVLTSQYRPTAVVAEDWRVCQAALAASTNLGIRIPTDLSLIAFGQNAFSLVGPLRVTCYVPDGQGVGTALADALTALIAGDPAPGEPIYVPGRIVEGDSVKPLNGSAS